MRLTGGGTTHTMRYMDEHESPSASENGAPAAPTDGLDALLASPEYRALAELHPGINCFEVLDSAVAPESWLKFLGFLLDSRAAHGLGQAFLRAWLGCLDLSAWPQAAPWLEQLPPAAGTHARVHKYWWGGGRFFEVLVEIAGEDEKPLAVLGIKNKHGCGEDRDELRDLQRQLAERFPAVPKLIVAVEGYQRAPFGLESAEGVPVIHQSVKTLVQAAAQMEARADATVDWLLACLVEFLEKRMLGIHCMNELARDHLRKLWASREHREALRQICRFTPTLRGVYDRLQFQVKKQVEEMPRETSPQGSILYSYFPLDGISPKEMKIEFIELNHRSERHGMWVVYVLDASATEPDVGDDVTLRIMAWWNDEAAKKMIDDMNLRNHLPASHGPLEGWANWEPIWVGRTHTLVDLGAEDLKALTEIVADGVRRTFKTVRERMYEVVKE
ncbi:MAG: hypothetical protein KIS92_01530 [Planctomycetota bacterium]|nr:hypothetical protein [Planctomycetota bacterium]